MNKQPVTVYVPVNVDERLPENTSAVFVICKDKRDNATVIDTTWYFGKHGFHIEDDGLFIVTHWLSPQQLIILTPEEWQRVEKCLDDAREEIENLHSALESDWRKSETWQFLNQLNEAK